MAMWPRTTITADRGGIAVGRDAHVTIEGVPPEQLQPLAAAVASLTQLTGEQRAIIAHLEHRLGASEEQVLMFFRIIGERDVPLEQIGNRLVEIAERFKTLLVQVESKPSDDPVVARLKTEAHAALEAGDFDRADALLDKVENAVLDRAALEAADVRAQRGEMALTRLRYRDAAGHFAAAAARVSSEYEKERLSYLWQEATALDRQGDEFGDNAALADAIACYRTLLALYPKDRVPLVWAAIQNNLGATLTELGRREEGTARLEEAVKAYCAVLEEWARARVPLQWATVQNNLGNVLFSLERVMD